MLKKSFFTLALLSSLPILAEEVARREPNRGAGYNRYDNHHLDANQYYNRYDQNRWNNERGNLNVSSEGIYDGVLLNTPYNPDVQYTQPGSTDDFESVYEQNQK